MPNAGIRSLKLGEFIMSFREAPLTLSTLAALVPPDLDFEIMIHDESVQKLNFEQYSDVDLVGVSVLTGTSVRAYEIADRFRLMGKKVVLGGVHVSILPEEARPHADSIVVGFAETVWPKLLQDFKNGNLQNEYTADREDRLDLIPHPRRDLQQMRRYAMPYTVMATRGCTNKCDFCSIPAYINGYHKRPIEDIVREVRAIPSKRFCFNDVSLVEDPQWTKSLLKALIPLKKKWGGLSTFDIYKDKEMMKLLEQSGCNYMLIGMESISQESLGKIYKGFNRVDSYAEGMKVFHDHGILVQGCFIFGLDTDTKDVFAETVERVNELKIDIPRYAIYTPYPGTKLFSRLSEEGRILTHNYSYYDTQHVVYKPTQMTPEELYQGFKWAYRETFKMSSIYKRLVRVNMDLSFPITLLGNLAYKIYVKELYSQNTFDTPEFYQSLLKEEHMRAAK